MCVCFQERKESAKNDCGNNQNTDEKPKRKFHCLEYGLKFADMSDDCLNFSLAYDRCVFDFSDGYILTQNNSGQTDIIGMATYGNEILPLGFKVRQLKRGDDAKQLCLFFRFVFFCSCMSRRQI